MATPVIALTPLAKRYLAERRAEAIRIVTGGSAYTRSQREIAWRHLTGLPPHPRAPQPQQPEPRGAA